MRTLSDCRELGQSKLGFSQATNRRLAWIAVDAIQLGKRVLADIASKTTGETKICATQNTRRSQHGVRVLMEK